MKRDYDIIRKILLVVEEKQKGIDIASWNLNNLSDFGDFDTDDVIGHFKLLLNAGFLNTDTRGDWLTSSSMYTAGLSWYGHEFLDTVRDEKIWRRTKEGARQVGSFSIEVIAGIAKAIINKKIKDITGGEFSLSGGEAA